MVVGVFGKSGSGKSTLCKYLEEKGFYYIDADKLGHFILKKGEVGYSEIISHFGSDFLDENGEIIRKKLGNYIFENNLGDTLSKITHPIIDSLVEKEIFDAENTHNNIVVDAALLCNTRIKDMCDKLILVKSDNCVERIIKRDNLEINQAKNRLNSQNIQENAHIIIENNGTKEEFLKKIDEIIRKEF